MSLFRTLSIAFEDMVVGIEGSFADMASLMIDPFQKLLGSHVAVNTDEDSEPHFHEEQTSDEEEVG
jgi:hypothetical protein